MQQCIAKEQCTYIIVWITIVYNSGIVACSPNSLLLFSLSLFLSLPFEVSLSHLISSLSLSFSLSLSLSLSLFLSLSLSSSLSPFNKCALSYALSVHYLMHYLVHYHYIGSNFFWKASGTMTTCTNGRKPHPLFTKTPP